ncbi:hypothetical protein ROZALSC1DRAFT_20126 [Rozella allomycis CSF55]|uniref:RNI-like protein n=1 Tax=Rozella allomycis (strain CSF55) TaxID=988480 RepID=A0A4P9YS24_ROZAC|nr:hypothetical protein ROZALSC1DRAFT_20126 [Rozella allomycis CSF55]
MSYLKVYLKDSEYLESASFHALSQTLKCNAYDFIESLPLKSLKGLHIRSVLELTSIEVYTLANKIEESNLSYLSLEGTPLHPRMHYFLGQAISKSKITHLWAPNCKLTPLFVDAISRKTPLKYINLANNPLGDIRLNNFFKTLAFSKVRHLNIERMGLTDENTSMLIKVLNNSEIQSLNIKENHLSMNFYECLFQSLLQNTSLKTLLIGSSTMHFSLLNVVGQTLEKTNLNYLGLYHGPAINQAIDTDFLLFVGNLKTAKLKKLAIFSALTTQQVILILSTAQDNNLIEIEFHNFSRII